MSRPSSSCCGRTRPQTPTCRSWRSSPGSACRSPAAPWQLTLTLDLYQGLRGDMPGQVQTCCKARNKLPLCSVQQDRGRCPFRGTYRRAPSLFRAEHCGISRAVLWQSRQFYVSFFKESTQRNSATLISQAGQPLCLEYQCSIFICGQKDTCLWLRRKVGYIAQRRLAPCATGCVQVAGVSVETQPHGGAPLNPLQLYLPFYAQKCAWHRDWGYAPRVMYCRARLRAALVAASRLPE